MENYPNRYQILLMIAFLSAALLAAGFMSCTREEITEHPGAVHPNGNSPAAHIAASEKLDIPAAVDLPANLPHGNIRVATFFAEGVQKYKAREKTSSVPLVYEWVLVAPRADLYDAANAMAGSHGAGPFWELSATDSIFGQQFSPPKTAPSPDAGSIDWLILMPKAGTTPTGIFADVDYIQRIATKGGKAPVVPPTNANETVEVKYKAVYRFTKRAG